MTQWWLFAVIVGDTLVLMLESVGDACDGVEGAVPGSGDVNFDGETNVLDVIASLNVIIGMTDPADVDDFECFELSGKTSYCHTPLR